MTASGIFTTFIGDKPDHTCCVGMDVPGVGHMHSYDCPEAGRSMVSGCREYVPGEVPQPLRDLVVGVDQTDRQAKLEGLLAKLLFAARDLAQRNTERLASGEVCHECKAERYPDLIRHRDTCRTGRVLRLIEEISDSIPKTKEVAPGGETGRAGDGIRPRGLNERVCLKCGARGGEWTAEPLPLGILGMNLLGLNQCVGAGPDGHGYTLYTHQCGKVRLVEGGAQ